MKTANSLYFDAQVQHAVGVERLKSGEARRVAMILARVETDLQKRLNSSLESITHNRENVDSVRLQRLIEYLRNTRREAWKAARDEFTGSLRDFSADEAQFHGELLHRVSPVVFDLRMPALNQIRAIATSDIIMGHSLASIFNDNMRNDIRRIEGAVRVGFLEGRPTPQIVSDVMDSVLISRRQVDAVVRTSLNHVANSARELVWQANADVVEALQWVSVLDGRTSLICISRDGNVYAINVGPRPPAHWRCRSIMIAFLGHNLVGERPFVRDTRTRRIREINFRAEARDRLGVNWSRLTEKQRRSEISVQRSIWQAENIGTVPARTLYPEWLRGQPREFVQEVLKGKTRAALFLDGKLAVDRFVDENGKLFNVSQLREDNAKLFRRLGL